MKRIFNGDSISRGKLFISQLDETLMFIDFELNKFIRRERPLRTRVPNTHILIRAILNTNVSLKRQDQDLVDSVEDMQYALCNSLGITNATGKGKVHTGEFFNGDTKEIIYCTDDHVRVSSFDKSDSNWWKKLKPVKIVSHPFTDLNFNIPDGDYINGQEAGRAVISISFPLLMLQFKYWCLNERRYDETSLKPTHNFVYIYPLLNCVADCMNISMFNRLINIASGLGENNVKFQRVTSVALVDHSARLDAALNRLNFNLKKNRLNFPDVINNLPSLTDEGLLVVPDYVPTKPIRWLDLVSRLEAYIFLFENFYATGDRANANQMYQIQMLKLLKSLESDKTIPTNFQSVVSEDVYYLKELLK